MNESTIGAIASLACQSQGKSIRINVASLGDQVLLTPETASSLYPHEPPLSPLLQLKIVLAGAREMLDRWRDDIPESTKLAHICCVHYEVTSARSKFGSARCGVLYLCVAARKATYSI